MVKLKGVGKVWQITGCDVASSYGFADLVVGEVTPRIVLAFLTTIVRPGYRRAGWTLKRVLVDNRKEFKGAFAAGCAQRGIIITHTKPRHAWTNGFVERLHKTILHEHWRVAFRRHYFTGCRAFKSRSNAFCNSITLNGLIRLSSERPHAGERLTRSGRDVTRGRGCQHLSETAHTRSSFALEGGCRLRNARFWQRLPVSRKCQG
jgi:transposase InsO family protein